MCVAVLHPRASRSVPLARHEGQPMLRSGWCRLASFASPSQIEFESFRPRGELTLSHDAPARHDASPTQSPVILEPAGLWPRNSRRAWVDEATWLQGSEMPWASSQILVQCSPLVHERGGPAEMRPSADAVCGGRRQVLERHLPPPAGICEKLNFLACGEKCGESGDGRVTVHCPT